MSEPVLQVQGLVVEFRQPDDRWLPALRGIDLEIGADQTLALVGESGSGKSVTSLSVMRLLPANGRIAAGAIRVDGQDLVRCSEAEMAAARGARVAMIFQEPMTALNPTMRIGRQVGETLRIHRGMSAEAAEREALRLLDLVRIPAAARRVRDYPHQLSGGMRQRVMIAMALACSPRLLLADEPTTALDVTIQAQVLGLLDDLKRAYGLSVLFVTHNLGVVAAIADRVAVMYAGQIVERGTVAEVFGAPAHPYTAALMRSVPRVDADGDTTGAIPGSVPPLGAIGSGCAFAPRCARAQPRCRSDAPPWTGAASGHRCWYPLASHG